MKEKLKWIVATLPGIAVAMLIALTVLVLFITRSRSSALPDTYKGLALPTPQPVEENAPIPPV